MNYMKCGEKVAKILPEKEYAAECDCSMDSPDFSSFKMDIVKLFDALVRIYAARGIELCIRYKRISKQESTEEDANSP